LQRLQHAGYDVGDSWDSARVAELVEWIKQVDCYEMRVTSLNEAVKQIQELIR
jgi:hypothetical protein